MDKQKDICTLDDTVPPETFVNFFENSNGIFLSSEDNFRDGHRVLKPETHQFAKWLKQNKPEVSIKVDECEDLIALRSFDVWFPLTFLASDIALPLYINYVYDYLKFKAKGLLSKDGVNVHLKIIFKEKDKCKEFDYSGPMEGLKNFKKIDINKLMNE